MGWVDPRVGLGWVTQLTGWVWSGRVTENGPTLTTLKWTFVVDDSDACYHYLDRDPDK